MISAFDAGFSGSLMNYLQKANFLNVRAARGGE
jgi:hypothetical protein